jgi:hypothetical protein
MAARTTLELKQAKAEGRTRFAITGSLPDGLPRYALHQFLSQLAYWSGERIDAVLCAADQAGWLEVWCDALAEVPERHLRVRFRIESVEERHSE